MILLNISRAKHFRCDPPKHAGPADEISVLDAGSFSRQSLRLKESAITDPEAAEHAHPRREGQLDAAVRTELKALAS